LVGEAVIGLGKTEEDEPGDVVARFTKFGGEKVRKSEEEKEGCEERGDK
jgi:hypothetical protein